LNVNHFLIEKLAIQISRADIFTPEMITASTYAKNAPVFSHQIRSIALARSTITHIMKTLADWCKTENRIYFVHRKNGESMVTHITYACSVFINGECKKYNRDIIAVKEN